jgi:hydroxymethylbilane synthase
MSIDTIVLGTRGSELALKQTTMVTEALQTAHPHLDIQRQIIHTMGDKRTDLRFDQFSTAEGVHVDKGIFIKELEVALESGQVHAAVHSLKDVPSDLGKQFKLAAILPRAAIEDVLITAAPATLATLPQGARVGTSSVRRARQLLWLRPDLQIVQIRGNVPTRVKKVLGEEALDAVLLAAAGLVRLGLLNASLSRIHLGDETALHALVLDPKEFLPAAGQGAIAIETLADASEVQAILQCLNHVETEVRVTAEREFLRLLGAGCQTPVGAHTWIAENRLHMAVRVFSETDLTAAPLELSHKALPSEPLELARHLADEVKRATGLVG